MLMDDITTGGMHQTTYAISDPFVSRLPKMKHFLATILLCCANPLTAFAADRFTAIVEAGGESTVTAGGFVVNQKRVAVQKELAIRPPTREEIGVELPKGSRFMLVETSRQIAQYHPHWRIYQYSVTMPRKDLISYFEGQGLTYDQHSANLKFGQDGGDFIDGLSADDRHQVRIWRRPQ